MAGSSEMRHRVQEYRKTVLIYESLHAEINALIKANNGSSDSMSEVDRQRYRELARKRDEVMNEMRWLESQLLDEEENI
jgi:hypothetical protein